VKFSNAEKNYKNGSLPGASAPLVMAYVPMQTSAVPSYEASEALARGTLFPGLDLPLMNIVNRNDDNTDEMVQEVLAFVTDWLVNHIYYSDKKIGEA